MIGTLNISDKATLFRLSFAFLRRFAVVEVPLPPADDYRAFFTQACGDIAQPARAQIVDAAMALAFAERQLGPAILHDMAEFVRTGLTQTASGQPTYADPVDAFVVATRLFAVPQYGARRARNEDRRRDSARHLVGSWR